MTLKLHLLVTSIILVSFVYVPCWHHSYCLLISAEATGRPKTSRVKNEIKQNIADSVFEHHCKRLHAFPVLSDCLGRNFPLLLIRSEEIKLRTK